MNKDNAHLYLPLVQALIDGKLQRNDGTAIYPEWNDARSLSEAVGIGNYRVNPLDFAPIPEGATWHNPDGLTPEQVGEGWRLLTAGEICENPPAYKACQCWLERGAWSDGSPYYGNSSSCTYRVPLSTPYPCGSFVKDGKLVKPWKPRFKVGDRVRVINTPDSEMIVSVVPDAHGYKLREPGLVWYDDELEPAPEPAKVPLGPADWMKDGPWWIRVDKSDKQPAMVIGVGVASINFGTQRVLCFKAAMTWERSNDGINWTPCWKLQ